MGMDGGLSVGAEMLFTVGPNQHVNGTVKYIGPLQEDTSGEEWVGVRVRRLFIYPASSAHLLIGFVLSMCAGGTGGAGRQTLGPAIFCVQAQARLVC
jgi:hypothetical protein